jgi:hypothetical protein
VAAVGDRRALDQVPLVIQQRPVLDQLIEIQRSRAMAGDPCAPNPDPGERDYLKDAG